MKYTFLILTFVIFIATTFIATAQCPTFSSYKVDNQTSGANACDYCYMVNYIDCSSNPQSSGMQYAISNQMNYCTLTNCDYVTSVRVYDSMYCGGGGTDATLTGLGTDLVGDCNSGTATAEWIDGQTTWIYP